MYPDYYLSMFSWMTLIIPLAMIGAPLMALIPGMLAKNKGYSFAAFYVPAIFVLVPMLIAAIAMRKKPGYVRQENLPVMNAPGLRPPAKYKYKERLISNDERKERLTALHAQGFISGGEFVAEIQNTGRWESAEPSER